MHGGRLVFAERNLHRALKGFITKQERFVKAFKTNDFV